MEFGTLLGILNLILAFWNFIDGDIRATKVFLILAFLTFIV